MIAPAPFHSGPDIHDVLFDGIEKKDNVQPGDLMPVRGVGDTHDFWQQGMVVALLPGGKIHLLVDAKSISEIIYKKHGQEGS